MNKYLENIQKFYENQVLCKHTFIKTEYVHGIERVWECKKCRLTREVNELSAQRNLRNHISVISNK